MYFTSVSHHVKDRVQAFLFKTSGGEQNIIIRGVERYLEKAGGINICHPEVEGRVKLWARN